MNRKHRSSPKPPTREPDHVLVRAHLAMRAAVREGNAEKVEAAALRYTRTRLELAYKRNLHVISGVLATIAEMIRATGA